MFVFIFACDYNLTEKTPPDDLIPQDSMELILSEMMLLEEYVKFKHVNINSYYKTMRKSGSILLERYDLDSARYYRSLDFYTRNQEAFIEMYSRIEKRLELDTLILD